MKKRRLLLLLPIMGMLFAGCNANNGGNGSEQQQQVEKKNFVGVAMESIKSVYYDGKAHSLILSGVPEGATVNYDGPHEFTEVGVYHVKVTVSKEGYNDLTLEGTLKILELKQFSGITLESSKTVYYDGQKHSLALTGVPKDAKVTYEGEHEFSEVGVHHVKVTISKDKYADLVLEGDLTILALQKFSGITLEADKTVEYDGLPHSLALTGVPEGAKVTYEGAHEFIEAGEHHVKVTISKEGYENLVLEGTLTITALNRFTGITFADTQVEYDGKPHKIPVSGAPEGTTITYDSEPVRPGVYTQKVTLSKEGYETRTLSAVLRIVLVNNTKGQMIDDFEGIGDSDLASDWKLEYYNNGWVTPSSASIKVAKNGIFGEGNSTMRMNLTHQGQAFKVTKDVSLKDKTKSYSGIKLDVRSDAPQSGGTVKAQVQFWFKDLPLPSLYEGYRNTYVTYTLSDKISSNWTHFEIPFNDSTISIAGGAISAEALEGQQLTLQEMSLYIDKVAILMTPNYLNGGPKAYAYVDNVELGDVTSRLEVEKVNVAGRSWTVESSDETVIKLSVDDKGAAKVESLNLEHNFSFDGTVEEDGKAISVTIPTSATKSVVLPFEASMGGAKLALGTPSGDVEALAQIKDHLAITDPLEEVLVVDDFESYKETGVGLDQSHTEAQMSGLRAAYHSDYYNEPAAKASLIGDVNWSLMGSSDYLNLGTGANAHSGSNSGDFKGSGNQMRYMTFGLAKGNAQPIGRGSKLSFWVKSSANTTLKAKAYYVNRVSTSNQGAESGEAVSKANISVTSKWQQVFIDLDPTREVYGIDLIPAKTACRIYVDDVEIHGKGNPWAAFVAPEPDKEITDGTFGAVAGNKGYSLTVSNSVTKATFTELGGEPTEFSATMGGSVLTLKDTASSGSALTITMTIDDENKLTVATVEGSAKGAFTGFIGKSLTKYAPVDLNFQNETADRDFTDSHWKQEKYTSSWVSAGTSMRIRHSSSNYYVNMTTGYSTSYRYTYTPDKLVGPANHFSAKITNDYSGCTDIKLKVKLTTTTSEKYLIGDANTWVTIPANTGNRSSNQWYSLDLKFDMCEVKSISFTIQSARSGNDYLYVDDISLGYKTPTPDKVVADGTFGAIAGDKGYSLTLSDSVTKATFTELGGEPSTYSVVMADSKLTLKDTASSGAGVTMVMTIADEKTLTVASVTGSASSAFTPFIGKSLTKYASMNADFQTETAGGQIKDTHWVAKKYTTEWVDAGKMNIRNSGTNVFANMPSGWNLDYTYTYTPDLKIGPANNFSVDIANDFDGAQEIKVKVKVIKADNSEAYIVGDGSNYVSIPANTGSRTGTWYHMEQSFALTDVKAVKFIVKSAKQGDAYLYVDNIKVGYKTPTPEPPAPQNVVSDGRYYIWNSNTDAYIIDLDDNVTTAKLTLVGNRSFSGTASQSNGKLTVTITDVITVVAKINDDGTLLITEVTGAQAQALSASLKNKTAKIGNPPNLTFDDGAGSGEYTNNKWQVQKYNNSTWESVNQSQAMNSRAISGDKIINMKASGNTRNFIYASGDSFGPVNHLDIDLGNYYSAAKDIKIKIKILDASDNVKAILTSNGADEFQVIPYSDVQNVLNTFSFNFAVCVGYKIRITTQATADTYLYVDNLVLSYKAK